VRGTIARRRVAALDASVSVGGGADDSGLQHRLDEERAALRRVGFAVTKYSPIFQTAHF
jgi:hypothetical protein